MAERASDWASMVSHGASAMAILGRSLRGIPTDIWIRVRDGHVSAVPAGLVLIVLSAASSAYAIVDGHMATAYRASLGLVAVGFLWLGIDALRWPRSIPVRRIPIPNLVLATGLVCLAFSLPETSQRSDRFADTPLLDAIEGVSFVVVALGLAALALSPRVGPTAMLVNLGGGFCLVGAFGVGVAETGWAIVFSSDLVEVAVLSFVFAVGSVAALWAVFRVRSLPVLGASQA